jgi:hypothetical protein
VISSAILLPRKKEERTQLVLDTSDSAEFGLLHCAVLYHNAYTTGNIFNRNTIIIIIKKCIRKGSSKETVVVSVSVPG